MENKKIYVIACKRGLYKQDCPFAIQQGIHCVECPYVVYISREKTHFENNSEQEKNTDNES